MREKIFEAKDVVIKFNLRGHTLTAIRGASIDLYDGESLAIVGESGSGKSVFTKSFIGMLDTNGWVEQGEMLLDGVNIAKYKTEKEWLKVRGKKIAMVFQDPMSSLNPVYKVGDQVAEGLLQHNKGMTKAQAREKVLEMFRKLGIPDPEERIDCYPHQFSGGMKQRVVIAIAMICNPELIICDEPTTALDVTIQAQIMELLKEMQTKDGKSIILITHNMGLVAEMADEVCVMYMGRVVEFGSLEDVFDRTSHPYTQALLRSVPVLGLADGQKLETIPGATPNPADLKGGCEFADRCPFCTDACREKDIPMFQLSPGHRVRCLKYQDYPVAEGGEVQAEVAEVQ